MIVSKRKFVAIVLVAVILSGLLGAGLFAWANPGASTSYVQPGAYPGAPTYMVWRESSTYYAKDIFGAIKFESSNCTYVVKSCLDAMISGVTLGSSTYFGILHFAKGLFEFDTEVLMVRTIGQGLKEGLIVEGEGKYTTILKAIGAHPIFEFTSEHRDDRFEAITIRSLEFTSDAVARSSGDHALIFVNATFTNIYDCYFENCYDAAVYMNGLETNFFHDNGIYHSYGYGIATNTVSDTHIYGNTFTNCSINAIDINNAVYDSIIGNTIIYSGNTGINLYSVSKSVVSNNPAIAISGWDGITLSYCENITVTGNVIFSNSWLSALDAGIYLGGTNCTEISNNRIFDDNPALEQVWGIEEGVACDYNQIIGNHLLNSGTSGYVRIRGANTKCGLCWNDTSTWLVAPT